MITAESVTISALIVPALLVMIVTVLSVTAPGAMAARHDLEQGRGDVVDVHLSRRTGLRRGQLQPDKPALDEVDALEAALLEEDGLLALHALRDVVDHRKVGELQLHAVAFGVRVGQDAVAAHACIALLIAAAPCKAARTTGFIAVLSEPGAIVGFLA